VVACVVLLHTKKDCLLFPSALKSYQICFPARPRSPVCAVRHASTGRSSSSCACVTAVVDRRDTNGTQVGLVSKYHHIFFGWCRFGRCRWCRVAGMFALSCSTLFHANASSISPKSFHSTPSTLYSLHVFKSLNYIMYCEKENKHRFEFLCVISFYEKRGVVVFCLQQ
jgi:hypothetical protein